MIRDNRNLTRPNSAHADCDAAKQLEIAPTRLTMILMRALHVD